MKRVSIDKNGIKKVVVIVLGIGLNYVLSYLTHRLELPLYFDTIGTMLVSFIAGVIPGIITAVVTNAVCTTFNSMSLYYSIINALIAISAYFYAKVDGFKSVKKTVRLILTVTLLGGALGSVFQWILIGHPQYKVISDMVESVSEITRLPVFPVFMISNIILNLVDKGISVGMAYLLLRLVPEQVHKDIYNSGWKQKPLKEKEVEKYNKQSEGFGHSMRSRVTYLLLIVSVSLIFLMSLSALYLYYQDVKKQDTENAWSAVSFAANFIDTSMLDEYAEKGIRAPGYTETKIMLYKVRQTASNIAYLYVVRIKDNKCQFIFDLEEDSSKIKTDEAVPSFQPGEYVDIEDSFKPYLPDLLEGKKVGPIESNGIWNRILTVYYPVFDKQGNIACYVGADVSLDYTSNYMFSFMFRVFTIIAGVLVLIVACGLWKASVYLTYPINAISTNTTEFVKDINKGGDIAVLNKDVSRLKKLNIKTDDEVENLYRILCILTEGITEQLWETRHYSTAVEKMQSSLIITMADMVENRDSDTGAHVQKTAEYVQIICNGLKKKGYYAEKLTPKYISDVVMSAPLHDVGKINIPDAVLNKPGKLDPDEYEIMKTHTTAGRSILEKAMSTVYGDNYLKEARNMAGYHHEKWNGKGYPDGLHGEVIPLSARIMAVADVFDALTSKRIYKPPFPLDKALSIISEGAGQDFDPKVVEVFMDSLDDVKKVLRKYKEYEGEI
ncbi:MAG: HD domain-containing protein [Lachnospiraceae bacterium]|nr:HD domain-containing protein [Lachnospiraceae bacterium]